jgi:hypothetical protein
MLSVKRAKLRNILIKKALSVYLTMLPPACGIFNSYVQYHSGSVNYIVYAV